MFYADAGLIAAGRVANTDRLNTDRLNLDAAAVRHDGTIELDQQCHTGRSPFLLMCRSQRTSALTIIWINTDAERRLPLSADGIHNG